MEKVCDFSAWNDLFLGRFFQPLENYSWELAGVARAPQQQLRSTLGWVCRFRSLSRTNPVSLSSGFTSQTQSKLYYMDWFYPSSTTKSRAKKPGPFLPLTSCWTFFRSLFLIPAPITEGMWMWQMTSDMKMTPESALITTGLKMGSQAWKSDRVSTFYLCLTKNLSGERKEINWQSGSIFTASFQIRTELIISVEDWKYTAILFQKEFSTSGAQSAWWCKALKFVSFPLVNSALAGKGNSQLSYKTN